MCLGCQKTFATCQKLHSHEAKCCALGLLNSHIGPSQKQHPKITCNKAEPAKGSFHEIPDIPEVNTDLIDSSSRDAEDQLMPLDNNEVSGWVEYFPPW